MRFLLLPCLISVGLVLHLLACGDDDEAPAPDAGAAETGGSSGTSSSPSTPLGSGNVEGTVPIAVLTTRWSDPGPFSGKARVEIVLSDDAACARGQTCTTFHQLFIRLSSPSGGTIEPGEYPAVIDNYDGGPHPSLEVRYETQNKTPTSCSAGGQPGKGGSVILETATATEMKGTFDLDVLLEDGTTGKFKGRFDAVRCP